MAKTFKPIHSRNREALMKNQNPIKDTKIQNNMYFPQVPKNTSHEHQHPQKLNKVFFPSLISFLIFQSLKKKSLISKMKIFDKMKLLKSSLVNKISPFSHHHLNRFCETTKSNSKYSFS